MKNVFAVVTALLLVIGCGQSGSTSAPKEPSDELQFDMKSLNLTYSMYCLMRNKAPAGLEDLEPHIVNTSFPESQRKAEERLLDRLQNGDYVVVWNQMLTNNDLSSKNPKLVAYESQAPREGGFAGFANGDVVWLSATEFGKIAPAADPTTSEKP